MISLHQMRPILLNEVVSKLCDIFRRFVLAEYATMLWTDFATAREVEDVAKDFMLSLMRHDRNSLPPLATAVLFDLQSNFPAFLLQKDKANAQEAMIKAALQGACTNGFSWCIWTLLKHGADTNAPGGRRYEKKKKLQVACRAGAGERRKSKLD